MATDPTREHFRQLDGLRGVAVLLVMLYHFGLIYESPLRTGSGFFQQAAQIGWIGVDLFFVLSGFLITGILIATRDQAQYFRNFLMRRFLRIWPLYYLNLVIFFLVLPFVMSVPDKMQSMIDQQSWFWLYGANWLFAREHGFNQTSGGYFWSLAVEEQFYLLWPFVVFWLSERNLLRLTTALLVFGLALRIGLIATGTDPASIYTITFTHLDGLAIGAILAICLRSNERTETLRKVVPYFLLPAAIAIVVARWFDGNFHFWSRHMAIYGYSAIAIVFGSLLLWALRSPPEAGVRRALSSRFLVAAGQFSYALYLIHVPIASFVDGALTWRLASWAPQMPYGARYWLLVAVMFGISWTLAVASWHLFEKRILALKNHFAYSSSRTASAIEPAGQSEQLRRAE